VPSASLCEGFSKFTLLLFLVQICIDEKVSEVTESNAGTMLERGLIVLVVLLFFGVALESSVINADLQGQ
jgi:hypothetical protein